MDTSVLRERRVELAYLGNVLLRGSRPSRHGAL